LVGSEGGREKRGEVSWIGVGVRVRPTEAAALFYGPSALLCSNKPMINYSIEPEKSLETDEASAFIYASLCSLPDSDLVLFLGESDPAATSTVVSLLITVKVGTCSHGFFQMQSDQY
jgi:hypothetical protein